MRQFRLFFGATVLAVCFVLTSCSQTTAPAHSVAGVFIATTPCDEVSKKLLHIPPDNKYEMMKWNLALHQDPGTFAPTTYKLACQYGLSKQGTRGFMEGAQTIEFKGEWIIEKVLTGTSAVTVYTLHTEDAAASLSFLQVGPNLLHLLDGDRRLVIGNGAWSYTLNRVDPVQATTLKFSPQAAPLAPLSADSLIVGVFDGRTPCNNGMLELNGISANGCQIIKYRLTFFQDIKTHTPTTFQLQNIYVGKGDNKYTTTGKWTITKGTQTDPNAIVYQLQPDSGKPQSISFLKADDNILFMLDKDRNLLVGNEYVSFTLNSVKR